MPAVANQQFERFDKSGVLEVLADHGMKALPKGVFIGAASGFVIAALEAAFNSRQHKGEGFTLVAVTMVPVCIAIGAGVGAFIDAARGSNVIYRVP